MFTRKHFKKTLFAVLILAAGSLAFVNVPNNKYFEIAKNLEIFANLYKEINANYVDDLEPGKLMRTGIDAMLNSLDPYTNYFAESDIEGFRYLTEGKYHGIGASYKPVNEYITITDLYENSPACKAGLKVGDVVTAIDGKSTKGKTNDEVETVMKGSPGTETELTIQRPGTSKEMKIRLKREEVDVPNVPYYSMLNEETGYLILTTFTQNAAANVEKAVRELKEKNPKLKGLVFDLRGNGGGLLNEAVNICNVFIPKGEVVVSTKGKVQDWDRSFRTSGMPVDEKLPLVVLIDKYSASASEIVSGTLQDLDRGVLVGQRSYGKGLVQNTKDIGYNAKVKLTTSKYYIPSGRCIQAVSYKDGQPVNIPDSLRAQFKTRNGRIVLDGGGIKPDVLLEKPHESALIKALTEKNMLFDYVTLYCTKHPTIPPVESFRFTEFDDFVHFLGSRNFEYSTDTEKALKSVREQAEKEKYAAGIGTELKAMEARILAEKKAEINKQKAQIIDLLEQEITARYYFHKGRIQINLRNDREVSEAIALINDPARYNSLLKKK